MTTAARRRRPARRRRSPRRMHWGWPATAAITGLAAFHTWPVPTVIAAVLVASGGLTYALRGQARHFLEVRARGGARTVHLPKQRRTVNHTLAAYQNMDGTQFEHAIADLAYRDPSVLSASVQGGANDRALDVLVTLNDGRRIAIQCKRHAPTNRVSAPVIYQVNGTYRAYHHCHQALIVTTSDFTRDAVTANASLPRNERLTLVDGAALARWAAGSTPPWNWNR